MILRNQNLLIVVYQKFKVHTQSFSINTISVKIKKKKKPKQNNKISKNYYRKIHGVIS